MFQRDSCLTGKLICACVHGICCRIYCICSFRLAGSPQSFSSQKRKELSVIIAPPSPGGLSRALVSVHPSLGFLIVKCLRITTDRDAKMKSLCLQFHQGCGEAHSFICWYAAPGKYLHSTWVSAAKRAEVACVHPGILGERRRGTKETSHGISSTQRQ